MNRIGWARSRMAPDNPSGDRFHILIFALPLILVSSCSGGPTTNGGQNLEAEVTSSGDYPCSGGISILGPLAFPRSRGTPQTEHRSFTMPMASETCVLVKNEEVSAAWIIIDGIEIIGPDEFNRPMREVARKLFLEEGNHELTVRLASGPGRQLTIELLAGCSLEIDDTVRPVIEVLQGYFGIEPVQVAALADTDGQTTSFVASELIVQNDDPSVVDRIVEKYNGVVLYRIEANDNQGAHLPATYLLRLDIGTADISTLTRDVSTLVAQSGALALGKWRVSSLDGLKLIGIAAAESLLSSGIDLNFVGTSDAIPDSTREAPRDDGPDAHHDAYDPIDWKHFSRCSRYSSERCWAVDTGVSSAWSLLYATGRLDRGNTYPFVATSLKIAVLDGGFACVDPDNPLFPYPDYPDFEARRIQPVDYPGSLPHPCSAENWSSCGDVKCPWHGTGVAGAATGIPDNQWGSAGSGGPVATPILYFTSAIKFLGIAAIYDAVANTDARIINMSWTYKVPTIVGWANSSFETATSWANWQGLLLFAAAGNEGSNVDDEDCFLGICWESWWIAPCENDGVICVGGLNWDYNWDQSIKAASSNYGHEHVDLWAPFNGYVGSNPSIGEAGNPPSRNIAIVSQGTSYSSPFAAGVAALVWKARTGLFHEEVEEIIRDTSNYFLDPQAGTMKGVNAYNAVLKAIGCYSIPRITFPADEQIFELNQPIQSFRASLTQIIDYSPVLPICIDVYERWVSSIDGEIGPLVASSVCGFDYDGFNESDAFLWNPLLSEGEHEISYDILAIDSEGRTYGCGGFKYDTVRVTVSNSAPFDVSIHEPNEGDVFCEGQEVTLVGEARDWNEDLPDDSFLWFGRYGNNEILLGQGREVTTTGLTVGIERVTLQVCDDHNECTTSEILIQVLPTSDPACGNLPPTCWIVTPIENQQFPFNGLDPVGGYYATVLLSGEATDDQDPISPLIYYWSSSVDGDLGEGPMIGTWLHVPDDCSQWHRIALRVTDIGGKYCEDIVNVLVLGPECISGGP